LPKSGPMGAGQCWLWYVVRYHRPGERGGVYFLSTTATNFIADVTQKLVLSTVTSVTTTFAVLLVVIVVGQTTNLVGQSVNLRFQVRRVGASATVIGTAALLIVSDVRHIRDIRDVRRGSATKLTFEFAQVKALARLTVTVVDLLQARATVNNRRHYGLASFGSVGLVTYRGHRSLRATGILHPLTLILHPLTELTTTGALSWTLGVAFTAQVRHLRQCLIHA